MGKMYRLGGGAEYKKRNDLTIGGAVDILYEGDLSVDVKSDGGRVSGKYEKVLRESTEFQTFIACLSG